jgi:hypothetical protein
MPTFSRKRSTCFFKTGSVLTLKLFCRGAEVLRTGLDEIRLVEALRTVRLAVVFAMMRLLLFDIQYNAFVLLCQAFCFLFIKKASTGCFPVFFFSLIQNDLPFPSGEAILLERFLSETPHRRNKQ